MASKEEIKVLLRKAAEARVASAWSKKAWPEPFRSHVGEVLAALVESIDA